MTSRSCLSIILAAGEGVRMKSALPKVLHPVAGLPMVAHVVRAAVAAGGGDIALVVGRGAEAVQAAVKPFAATAESFVQAERLGTAHAVLAARDAIARGYDDVLVAFGDTPLVEPASLATARARLAEGAAVVVMGFRTAQPDRLRPADRKGRAARRDPRGTRLLRRGAQDRFLQWRADGDRRPPGAVAARRRRQRQRQGRILPHRHRRDRARQGSPCRGDRSVVRQRARHQQPRRAGRGRGHLAEAQAARDDARGRHHDPARNRCFRL